MYTIYFNIYSGPALRGGKVVHLSRASRLKFTLKNILHENRIGIGYR